LDREEGWGRSDGTVCWSKQQVLWPLPRPTYLMQDESGWWSMHENSRPWLPQQTWAGIPTYNRHLCHFWCSRIQHLPTSAWFWPFVDIDLTSLIGMDSPQLARQLGRKLQPKCFWLFMAYNKILWSNIKWWHCIIEKYDEVLDSSLAPSMLDESEKQAAALILLTPKNVSSCWTRNPTAANSELA
jgi:hypothetical protein